ncbi:AP-1 complex subunit mu-1-I [Candida viswanathii]|uniref:AP-1 complex subunit mu-1-I n=1 Tax=Candida viswanathii TaxID=5486 RepID=A0A367XR59_9ASCO|nr:AP-1 complex subunit mu-1-I [Candida viswanathii]
MISAIYVLYLSEEQHADDFHQVQLLVNRRFNESIPCDQIIVQNFHNLLTTLQPYEQVPILHHGQLSYVYIRCANGIILLAVINKNVNVMLVITFLNQLHVILIHYLCNSKLNNDIHKPLNRDIIIDNVTLIMEVLDECLDYGLLQVTDYKLLEEYIKVMPNMPKIDTTNGYFDSSESEESDHDDENIDQKKKKKAKSKKKGIKKKKEEIKSTHNQAVKTDVMERQPDVINSSILRTYSLAINWRPKGIFYAKNEIFIDIIEDCEFVYDLGTGVIKRNEIYGTCVVKSYLSGMPICRIGFNEKYMTRIESDYEEEVESRESTPIPENQLKLDDSEIIEDEEDAELVSQISEESSVSSISTQKKPKHKIPLRNIQFHQCIELSKIYKENLVTFIPPDDKFILMTYNVEQQKQKRKMPLITVKPTYRVVAETGKLQVMCTLNTNFHRRRHGKSVVIRIPINPHYFELDPNDTDLKYKTELGEVSFKIDSYELVWKIDSIDGKKMVRMMTELTLVNSQNVNEETVRNYISRRIMKPLEADTAEDDKIDTGREELDEFYGVNGKSSSLVKRITSKIKDGFFNDDVLVHFKLPMVTYSGLKLSYLSVEEEQMKYPCFPWVRYLTKSIDHYEADVTIENQKFSGVRCDYRFKIAMNCFTFA